MGSNLLKELDDLLDLFFGGIFWILLIIAFLSGFSYYFPKAKGKRELGILDEKVADFIEKIWSKITKRS